MVLLEIRLQITWISNTLDPHTYSPISIHTNDENLLYHLRSQAIKSRFLDTNYASQTSPVSQDVKISQDLRVMEQMWLCTSSWSSKEMLISRLVRFFVSAMSCNVYMGWVSHDPPTLPYPGRQELTLYVVGPGRRINEEPISYIRYIGVSYSRYCEACWT